MHTVSMHQIKSLCRSLNGCCVGMGQRALLRDLMPMVEQLSDDDPTWPSPVPEFVVIVENLIGYRPRLISVVGNAPIDQIEFIQNDMILSATDDFFEHGLGYYMLRLVGFIEDERGITGDYEIIGFRPEVPA